MSDASLGRGMADAAEWPVSSAQGQARPRVLLLAYACTPFHGSENATGWNRAVQTARFCDTWVICEAHECAGDIARHLAARGPIAGLHFCFVAKTPFQRALERIPGLYYLSYHLWHRQAYQAAFRLHAAAPFDLVHQANMCGYREPGYLWRLDAPFVWGPVGGTQNYPWRFLGEAGVKGAAAELIRAGVNTLQLRFSPRVRRAARRAAAILVANSTVRRDLERAHGVATTTLIETGLCRPPRGISRVPDPGRPLRILWAGHIEPWKALSLLIKALARLPDDVRYELRILGHGSQRPRCERLARALGVARHCTWLGWVPRDQVMLHYDWADLFAFTSLRDTTGTVVCEALGAGLPIVCLDHQGVGDIVDASCGIKVPVTTPREVTAGLRAAILKLARDRALCHRLGEGALRRARSYEWSHLAERTVSIYTDVLAQRASTVTGLAAPVRSGGSSGVGDAVGADHRAWLDRARVARAARRLVKHAAAGASAGLHRALGSRAGDSLGILLYHSIAEEVPGVPLAPYNVPPARFRAQLQGLRERGYQFWPLGRALEQHAAGRPFLPKTVVLTFDDGYASVFTQAWPVLRALNIPATVFLATAFLDRDQPFPFDDWGVTHQDRVPGEALRPMTTAQCRELARSGLIELGAHTHTHQDFRHRADDFDLDLRTCVDLLRRRFDLDDIAFAFPYGKPSLGYADRDLVEAARRVGVTCGLTTEDVVVPPHADPFAWGRFNVYAFDTAATVAAKLAGWYSWAPTLQVLAAGRRWSQSGAYLGLLCLPLGV
jgi:glycosyltransferase involved in cell wall biosynthesis/peptidoglycan/xylan/chitin deacetylase (PgdA/CDA1 family)